MNDGFADASSSNEAVHLQQRLRSLSTELVTLRNRLHVTQPANGSSPAGLSKNVSENNASPTATSAPAVPPRTSLPSLNGNSHTAGYTLTASATVHPTSNNHSLPSLNHAFPSNNNLITGKCPLEAIEGMVHLLARWRSSWSRQF